MRYFLSALALTAIASSCVTAKSAIGINCRGSLMCPLFAPKNESIMNHDIAKTLRDLIVNDTHWYEDGEHIKCIEGKWISGGDICAFLEGTRGLSGYDIKTLAYRITEHNCQVCGGVPVYFDKKENDVRLHGQLKFDFVS